MRQRDYHGLEFANYFSSERPSVKSHFYEMEFAHREELLRDYIAEARQ